MESEDTNNYAPADAFWEWFASHADDVAVNPMNGDFVSELDEQVSLAWPLLAWEIGPDPAGGWYFALSPNLDRDLFEQSKAAIRLAPAIAGWKFYPARQKKAWDGHFEIHTSDGVKAFNAANWRFVFLQYPDKANELVLVTPEASTLDADHRWLAAAILLEGVLGEERLMAALDSFSLVDQLDDALKFKTKPVSELAGVFGVAK